MRQAPLSLFNRFGRILGIPHCSLNPGQTMKEIAEVISLREQLLHLGSSFRVQSNSIGIQLAR